MLTGLLRAVGLVRASQVRALADQVESAKSRGAEMKRHLEEARDDVGRMKRQLEEARDDARRRGEEASRRLADATREVQRCKARDAELRDELAALRERFDRLKAAEQTTALAREHLLAIETKLDIVEGAIDVLDRRTRAAVATGSEAQPGGGGRS